MELFKDIYKIYSKKSGGTMIHAIQKLRIKRTGNKNRKEQEKRKIKRL